MTTPPDGIRARVEVAEGLIRGLPDPGDSALQRTANIDEAMRLMINFRTQILRETVALLDGFKPSCDPMAELRRMAEMPFMTPSVPSVPSVGAVLTAIEARGDDGTAGVPVHG